MIFREILDWMEVWALLIPLFFFGSWQRTPGYLKPVKIYILLALIINTMATVVWKFKQPWGIQEGDFWWSNNFLYNSHSIIRLLLLSYFFILLRQHFMHRVKAVLPILFILFAAVNFIFYENFFDRWMLSSRLLATEAAILLFYCLQYFIFLVIEDRDTPLRKQQGFWVVTGLSIYVSIGFFIFLFYTHLILQNWTFAVGIWDVHNIGYLIMCILIARAFYEETHR